MGTPFPRGLTQRMTGYSTEPAVWCMAMEGEIQSPNVVGNCTGFDLPSLDGRMAGWQDGCS